VNAIAEGDGKYEIDAATCIDCGACEAGCPVGAIATE
ncbi:MAG: 4Fe-4S dicluster domain-containing protein, partial [Lachnospiraceae bacterium]|nr:4Fe-4S dicluster domain-containing protein [Lachnospiraceae bacterium]